jgi:transcriptional regulator with XRE-family HTH domain
MSRAADGTEQLARHFGRALWRTRRRAGFSQEELAVLASLHRTEIGLLEHGQRLPRLDTIVKLAIVLAVPPGELLDGMSWMPGRTRRGTFFVSDTPGSPSDGAATR